MSVTLHRLIDQVHAAAAEAHLPYPAESRPRVNVGLHDYTTQAFLFSLDFDRFFTDIAYFTEQTLAVNLWRHANIRDDILITPGITSSLGYYPEYTYLGMTVAVDAQGVAHIQTDHPLSRDPDLRLLPVVDFTTSGWMPRVLRWHDALVEVIGDRMPVSFGMTWWRGPLDLAIQLRGYEAFMEDVAERPEFVHGLLQGITERRCRWFEGYYAHFGLELAPAPIGDDWLNVPFISPDFFAEFVLPCYLEIEHFHGGLAWLHSCGNQGPLQPYLLKLTSLEHFEVSPWTDMHETLRNIPPDKGLGFDLHPTAVLLDPSDVQREKLQAIKTACTGRRYNVQGGAALCLDSREVYVQRLQEWLVTAYEVFAGSSERRQAHNKDVTDVSSVLRR